MEDLYIQSVEQAAEFYGIDGCPSGWFYVGIGIRGECHFGVLEKFSDVGLFADDAKLILVDIPIGLVSSKCPTRACDTARACWNVQKFYLVSKAQISGIFSISRTT